MTTKKTPKKSGGYSDIVSDGGMDPRHDYEESRRREQQKKTRVIVPVVFRIRDPELRRRLECFVVAERARTGYPIDTTAVAARALDEWLAQNVSALTPPAAKPTTQKAIPSGGCHAGKDGECNWRECPQLRDGEPHRSGRHCPRDRDIDDHEG